MNQILQESVDESEWLKEIPEEIAGGNTHVTIRISSENNMAALRLQHGNDREIGNVMATGQLLNPPIRVGEMIETASGRIGKVKGIEMKRDGERVIYNIHTESGNTYSLDSAESLKLEEVAEIPVDAGAYVVIRLAGGGEKAVQERISRGNAGRHNSMEEFGIGSAAVMGSLKKPIKVGETVSTGMGSISGVNKIVRGMSPDGRCMYWIYSPNGTIYSYDPSENQHH